MPVRRVGRVTVDNSDGDVAIRLGEWSGKSVNRPSGLVALTAIVLSVVASWLFGRTIVLIPGALIGVIFGIAWAAREKLGPPVVEIRARGTVLHLLGRGGRLRRAIPIDSVDRVGAGRDGKRMSLWVQRGIEREAVFFDLEPEEAELARDALDRRVSLPHEPYR